ncbi:MAG TPA: hypothetical protein EYQ86_03730, partial [Bacteroidetes bacterium]|nr:hypothetical protein [Bacteroidota bacterium]
MNKVKPILFLVISFLSYCDIVIAQQIPALEWVAHIGGDSVETVYDMSVDRSGNVIICGSFEGTVDFDPGGGMFNLTSKGNKDIFIQKTDPYGNFMWAKNIGGTYDDEAYSLATDSSGNVYVTGYFKEVVLFDSSSNTILTSVNTSPDIFILKLDSFGNFKWAHQIGNYDFDEGYAITADDSAYVYITGKFSGPVDFDPGIQDTFNLIAPSSYDIFVLKLDSSGDFIWAKQMGGDGYDIGKDIAVDTLGNVHITGYFDDTADFDPGIDTFNLISHGTYDSY